MQLQQNKGSSLVQTSIIANLKQISDPYFGLPLVEFTFKVPRKYNSETYVDEYVEKAKKLKNIFFYSDDFTSSNFSAVSHKLTPNHEYTAKIYPILTTVSSSQCLEFLKEQKGLLVGTQGLMLIQTLHGDLFPLKRRIVSLDERPGLWKDKMDHARIIFARRTSPQKSEIGSLFLNSMWFSDRCLLCVTKS